MQPRRRRRRIRKVRAKKTAEDRVRSVVPGKNGENGVTTPATTPKIQIKNAATSPAQVLFKGGRREGGEG